jgi:hypothetical protein
MTTRHYQLFWALQHFLLKTSFNFSKVIRLAKSTEQIDFGEVLNRTLPFTLARTLVIRGVRDSTKLTETHTLLQRLWSLTTHAPSQLTLQFFPPSLQDFYCHKVSAIKRVPRDVVIAEVQRISAFTIDQLSEYYNSNEEAQLFLLCVVWRLMCESLKNQTYPPTASPLYQALPILYHYIPPQQLTRSVYLLVQHILDCINTPHNEIQSSAISLTFPFAVMTSALTEMVWGERAFFDFVTLLCALADQLTNHPLEYATHALALLRYLLLNDPRWTSCLNDFYALKLNVDPWKEDDWDKLMCNHLKYPPKWVLSCPPPTPSVSSTVTSSVLTSTSTTIATSNSNILPSPFPSVHSHVCISVLPALDYLLCKLIEAELIDPFYEFIEAFHPLYAYHSTPLTFVHDTLFYYYQSPAFRKDPNMKLALLKILLVPKISFSQFFSQAVMNSNFVFTVDYFNELLRMLHDGTLLFFHSSLHDSVLHYALKKVDY